MLRVDKVEFILDEQTLNQAVSLIWFIYWKKFNSNNIC